MDQDRFAQERTDLLETLHFQRAFLLKTAEGLTEEQARQRSTASELTIGGLIKHVAATEAGWAGFITAGTESMKRDGRDWTEWTEEDWQARANDFVLLEDETLAQIVDNYRAVAAATDELVRTVDLDATQDLPDAPWFTGPKARTARRTLQHIAIETAQHTGHADIIRESIDGQKSMG